MSDNTHSTTYDDLIHLGDIENIDALNESLADDSAETSETIKGKIRMAHNLGYARGYKAAMEKYAVKDTDVKEILGYK